MYIYLYIYIYILKVTEVNHIHMYTEDSEVAIPFCCSIKL